MEAKVRSALGLKPAAAPMAPDKAEKPEKAGR
jgi:hypothetical protein